MSAWRKNLGRIWLLAACTATLCVYCLCAYAGTAVCGNDDPREAVYNRMIGGFAKGHLSLDRDVPPGFAHLQDPYDPEQNSPYRAPPYCLYDLSYYRGRLYAYFGPAPALLLFGPFRLLTGHYLSYKVAAVLFCSLGFFVAAWLLLSARRRCAPETPDWVMAVVLLTVGLATGVPTLLARVDIWEMPIAGATALSLCAVAASWQAWHQPARRAGWLAAASLCLGLAVATRPTALLDAPILILPLVREWRENRLGRWAAILAGAALPLLVCLCALALYNVARFGDPLEFGQRYQIAALEYVGKLRQFGLGYVWDNVRIYFLNFTPWRTAFPFIGDAPKVALHAGHAEPEFCFGILGDVPIAVLALAALWARRLGDGLAFLAVAVLWIALAQIGLLLVFFGAVSRYEVEMLTPLLYLAAVGLLAAEARRRRIFFFRGLWIALAAASVGFNVCHAAVHAAWTRQKASYWFFSLHQTQATLDDYDILVHLEPPSAGLRNARGVVLGMLGRWGEAAAEFETAIRLEPGNADAHRNLGIAFLEEKKAGAAVGPLRESLRLRPGDPGAKVALERALQTQDSDSGAAAR